jgi:hypothetical protein
MSLLRAAQLFREKADMYLDMTGFVRDERRRRVLHEMFEESEAKAEMLERMIELYERLDASRFGKLLN